MKRFTAGLSLLLAFPFQPLEAAFQALPVQMRICIIQDGFRRFEMSRPFYNFRVEVISDSEGIKPEHYRGSRPWITAQPEERFAVRLYNPLPVRVAVNLTVDGINSISGRPSGIKDGQKWMIDPYSFITIRGWQVNGEEARRFFFTEKPKSYANWRGDEMGRNLAANCGVIGAAYFWSQKELDDYYEAHPQYRYFPCTTPCLSGSGGMLQDKAYGARGMNMAATGAPEPAAAKEQAGTGMGERESNPTQLVAFDYDAGMFTLRQAVVLYYDFAESPTPNPFPALSYAPEMP